MYAHLIVATPKSADAYTWFTHKGRAVTLTYRGSEVALLNTQRFGIRKSSDGKKIRLVLEQNHNKVFTIDLALAKKIANIG